MIHFIMIRLKEFYVRILSLWVYKNSLYLYGIPFFVLHNVFVMLTVFENLYSVSFQKCPSSFQIFYSTMIFAEYTNFLATGISIATLAWLDIVWLVKSTSTKTDCEGRAAESFTLSNSVTSKSCEIFIIISFIWN